MNSLAIFALALLITTGSDPLPTALPAAMGMDGKALLDAASLYRAAVDEGRIKGGVLLVARGGKVVLHQAIGLRDVEHELPFLPDTLFRMASNTKPVVAAAVLALVEDRKIALSDPVSKHLPAFKTGDSAKITVHELLTHTSGFRIDSLFLRPLLEDSTLQKEVDRFAAVGPEVEPGTRFAYSNPGYNTLGALVEVVSGMPLEVFLTERFYARLGMDDTSNHEVPEREARMATVYRYRDGEVTRRWGPGDPADFPFARASGGMISTAPDYFRFLQMYLDGGAFAGRRLLAKSSVKLATSGHSREVYSEEEAAARERFYGYGWSVDRSGRYAHGGSDGTFAWVDPANQLVGIVFTQSPGGDAPREAFIDRVTEACTGPVQIPPAAESTLNGYFLDPDMEVKEWMERFEGESREIAKHRDALVDAIDLKPGDAVADIGAGTGLFTGAMSRSVGDAGEVYAVDISPAFIDHLNQRATAQGWTNVRPVECTERSTLLDAGSIDAAFICDTYHHFSHPAETLASLFAAIRPGGRLVVVDFIRDPAKSRAWVLQHARAGKEVFRAEIEGAGFQFIDEVEIEGLSENYVIRFRRP